MIQKLKRNWLVLNMTWGTSQILTRALKSMKNLCFNWLLVTKVYIVWATKVLRSYLSQHWGDMQILKKNWLVFWKKNWKICQIFHQSTWKCQKWDFDEILLSKDLSKVLMWELHYEYIKLFFTDTDSLMYEIKTKDVVYKDLSNYKEMLDLYAIMQ